MATSAESLQATSPGRGPSSERSIGQLVADASSDVSSIVRSEIELAKVEITRDLGHAGKGAGMFAGAAVLGLFAFGLLLLALAWGLAAAGLPLWLSLLLVGVLLLVVAGVLAMIGKKQVSQVKGKPEKTIDNAKRTIEAVKPAKDAVKPAKQDAAA